MTSQRWVKKIWEFDAVYFDGENADEVIEFANNHHCYWAELEAATHYSKAYISLNCFSGYFDLNAGSYFVIREDGKKAKIVDGFDFEDDFSKSPFPAS